MNPHQQLFDAQADYFRTNFTRSYEWRVEQLDRMAKMLAVNEKPLQQAIASDVKTAFQEYVFETLVSGWEAEYQKSELKKWMELVEAPIPQFLAKAGHKAMVYREPHGVALIVGPFTLLIRFALTALRVSNDWKIASEILLPVPPAPVVKD